MNSLVVAPPSAPDVPALTILRTDEEFLAAAAAIRAAGLARLEAVQSIDELIDQHNKTAAMERYVSSAIKMREAQLAAQNDIADLRVREESRIGQWLAANVVSGTRSSDSTNSPRTLAELGLSKFQSAAWQKEASVPVEVLDAYITESKTVGREITSAGFLRFASETDDYDRNEWYTPAREIAAVRCVLGEIDLDPASCEFAQRTVKALSYFTKEDNGLQFEWPGRVFLNPPYSDPECRVFTSYLMEQYELGITTAAILLVNNATDTKWFQALLRRYPVCLTEGRISFERSDFEKFANRQGQAFFYLGEDPTYFYEVFSPIGAILQPIISEAA